MKTAKERENEFKKDLNALLKKHNAEIMLEKEHNSSRIYGRMDSIIVYMDAKYNDDHDCIEEYTELDLGRYIDGN